MTEPAVTVAIQKTGYDLIRDPLLNKGTAFTAEERNTLGLEGLLPSEINTMDKQAKRVFASIQRLPDPLDRYVALTTLQDRNEHLFYRVLMDHIDDLMPIVYTPTVGLATQNFSQVFRRGRGIWLTPDFRGRIETVLRAATAGRSIKLIVVTDNESILGIGDQGAGGMAISVGKLALYTAGAGIEPSATLPISLDVGTDNEKLLNDELYLGWRQPRLRGPDYDTLVDEFVSAVRSVCPAALLQWEDFRKENALDLLDRHRQTLPSFNDDIQGTGAVALAGILSALRISGGALEDQRVVIFGAGAAGLGIARQIRAALTKRGLDDAAIRSRIGVLDSRGLVVSDREFRDDYKRELAWTPEQAAAVGLGDPEQRGLHAVVEHFAPTVLIGSSGRAGAFDETVVRRMAAQTERPIILPFSNPTSSSEAVPADVLAWSEGRALIATGSPFDPVTMGDRTIEIGQGNNVFVFPGLGLGTLASGAQEVTDAMVSAASAALAASLAPEELDRGMLFPSVERLRPVTRAVALAVAEQAYEDGVAQRTPAEVDGALDAGMWTPVYPNYVRG